MIKNPKRALLLAAPPVLAGLVLLAVVYAYPPARAAHTPAPTASVDTPRDPDRLWCREHGVYEDECYICHPELEHGGDDHDHAGHGRGAPAGLMCGEHRLLEAECAPCHPDIAAALRPGEGMKLRVASAALTDAAGIRTGFAQGGSTGAPSRVLSRVAYNGNRLARVTPLVPGVVKSVAVDVGDTVKQGQVLAVVASPDLSRARAAYQSSLSEEARRAETHTREKELFEKRISAKQDYLAAEADLRAARIETAAARQALLDLGLDPREAGRTGAPADLPVRAPFDGTVVERSAVQGEAVDPGAPLFTVTDLSTLWLELAIPEDRVAAVKPGDVAVARFNTLPGVSFDAEVVWLDSRVDPQDRTVKARALIPNIHGALREGMLGEVLLAPGGSSAMELPVDAVQSLDGTSFVFVKLEDDVYELRGVALGSRRQDRVEIVEGLSPREEVVVARSYTLKSELLKERLGAGCTHD